MVTGDGTRNSTFPLLPFGPQASPNHHLFLMAQRAICWTVSGYPRTSSTFQTSSPSQSTSSLLICTHKQLQLVRIYKKVQLAGAPAQPIVAGAPAEAPGQPVTPAVPRPPARAPREGSAGQGTGSSKVRGLGWGGRPSAQYFAGRRCEHLSG